MPSQLITVDLLVSIKNLAGWLVARVPNAKCDVATSTFLPKYARYFIRYSSRYMIDKPR